MKKEDLYEALDKWLKYNAVDGTDTFKIMRTAEAIEINELYQDDVIGINESYYIIILTSKQSLTGMPKIFMFQSDDLLTIDKYGDIANVKSIDYKVVMQ